MSGFEPDAFTWAEREERGSPSSTASRRCAKRVTGRGGRARLDWWLGHFRCLRALTEVGARWHEFDLAMAEARAQADPTARARAAEANALPIYRLIIVAAYEAVTLKMQTVAYRGGMATVRGLCWCLGAIADDPTSHDHGPLGRPAKQLREILGHELPADAALPHRYLGKPLLVVPTVRDQVFHDEHLTVHAALRRCPRRADRQQNGDGARWAVASTAPLPLRHGERSEYLAEFCRRDARLRCDRVLHALRHGLRQQR